MYVRSINTLNTLAVTARGIKFFGRSIEKGVAIFARRFFCTSVRFSEKVFFTKVILF